MVNGKYPLGIVNKDDWNGKESMFDFIIKTLAHDVRKRITNGSEMRKSLEENLTN